MSREIGTFNFAANFEVNKKSPLDAKQLVGLKSDLTDGTTWTGATGSAWLYNGAMVTVGDDPVDDNNGIYWLCDAANYTVVDSWKKVGEGAGVSNLTGATNGLNLFSTGTSVGLGGALCQNTVISGGTHDLSFGDAASFIAGTTFLTKSFGVTGDGLFNSLSMKGEFGTEAGCFRVLTTNSSGTSSAQLSVCNDDAELPLVTLSLGSGSLKNEILMCGDHYRQEIVGYTGDTATYVGCICTDNIANGQTNWYLYDTNVGLTSGLDYNASLSVKRHTFGINNQDILHICSGGTARYGVATGATHITHDADLTNKAYVDNVVTTGITANSNTVDVCNVNATYTATTENDFIGVSGGSCIFLPATPKACQRITVVDISGDALISNIDVNGNGTLINGCSNATINTEYGSITFINNNILGWSAVAFIN